MFAKRFFALLDSGVTETRLVLVVIFIGSTVLL
jgi:hypothetical protein